MQLRLNWVNLGLSPSSSRTHCIYINQKLLSRNRKCWQMPMIGPITNTMLTLLIEVKEIRRNHLKLYTQEKGTLKHNTTFFLYYYTTPKKKSSFLSPPHFTILNDFSRKKQCLFSSQVWWWQKLRTAKFTFWCHW